MSTACSISRRNRLRRNRTRTVTRTEMNTCVIVDDSSVIRKVARRILEGLDFQIQEAEDGEQALDVCRKGLPEAILLDWNMPKMDGYEFLRSLRRLPGGEASAG